MSKTTVYVDELIREYLMYRYFIAGCSFFYIRHRSSRNSLGWWGLERVLVVGPCLGEGIGAECGRALQRIYCVWLDPVNALSSCPKFRYILHISPQGSMPALYVLLTKITAAQNEVALSYHR